jgi:hypothetical protein
MSMDTVIQLQRDINFSRLEEDLEALRLRPKTDYKLNFHYKENEISIEFMNPMKASLWRIAVGYKYI